MSEPRTIVVALGGNAILQPGHKGTFDEQDEAVKLTCEELAELVAHGDRLLVTHGNGPQVGNILIRHEMAAGVVPRMPLDVCGAESQGQIGYMIQRNLRNALRLRHIDAEVVTITSQTLVDQDDPAFRSPTKPIGPFYSRDEARQAMAQKGERWIEDAGRGWRKVVPSPDPVAIVESEVVRQLLAAGMVVIASGGGGIPVRKAPDGRLQGVEAVVDKDLAAQRLAAAAGADILMILTDVHKVSLGFRTPRQRDLDVISSSEARRYIAEGHFSPGSMLPKVLAAVRFVEGGGDFAAICSLEEAIAALAGRAGTRVTRG
ncbi:MAG: carbamate kinase [Chloroflexi bacterium]|nr:carbamate kinase [Chloroflexota bacterium]